MSKTVQSTVKNFLRSRTKNSFDLEELESYVQNQFSSMNEYYDVGGREELRSVIIGLSDQGEIEIVKSKRKIQHPLLNIPLYWRKSKKQQTERWNRSDIFKYGDLLNLRYFVEHPDKQTDLNLQRIRILYEFLKNKQNRKVVTLEERMYELFKKEKWYSDTKEKGKDFLAKVGVSVEDLVAKKFPEPIPHETRNRMPLRDVQTILIIENNSFYHSVRRYLEEEKQVTNLTVDMIVYARGKQTIANLEYMYTLFDDATSRQYYYIGDIDPEGFSIFMETKHRYEDLNIQLATEIYRWMIREEPNPPMLETFQIQNQNNFVLFLNEFSKEGDEYYRSVFEKMWAEQRRIPQEVTNYEKLMEKRW